MKKCYALILVWCICFMFGNVSLAKVSFSDIQGKNCEEAIVNLAELGIVNGYQDGTYKPNNIVTRAEMAKLIISILERNDTTDVGLNLPITFTDINENHWAYRYVREAQNRNIINGYPDDTFKPNGVVTYAEATTMIVRAMGYKNEAEKLGSWPYNYIAYAQDLKLYDSMDQVDMTSGAIRGNVAIMLWNMVQNIETNGIAGAKEVVLKINNDYYTKSEFEKFLKYTLYKNGGEIPIDEKIYADALEFGFSREDLFVSDAINDFYKLKVYELVEKDKNILLNAEAIQNIKNNFETDRNKIISSGLTEIEYIYFEEQVAIMEEIDANPSKYLELPKGFLDEYLSQFSKEERKSYTYRMLVVNYDKDNKAEKNEHIKSLIDRINAGENFEKVAENADNRLIYVGNRIVFDKSIEEYSVGFLLEQKVGKEMYDEMKKTNIGSLTSIVDASESFSVAKIVDIQNGTEGKAKDELEDLMIEKYASEFVFNYVKNMEVNQSALASIKVKYDVNQK